MKKILKLLLALCVSVVLLALVGCEQEQVKIPEPSEKFFVNDFAGVISESDAEDIFSYGLALDKAVADKLGKDTGAQVVAVTVTTTDGEEPADYALRIGREWGVGNSEDNNGVVILLATEDREVFVSVGYGLEGALPDSKVGRLIDNYGYDYFAENEFSSGMKALYIAVIREVYDEYDLDIPEDISALLKYSPDVDLTDVGISWIIIALIVIICFIYFWSHGLYIPIGIIGRGFSDGFFGSSGRGSGGGFGGFSGGGGSFGGGGAGRGF